MNNIDTVLFVRDQMLANPHADADKVYDIAKLAEEDSDMFKLMMDWMYETDKRTRKDLEEQMVEYLDEKGL